MPLQELKLVVPTYKGRLFADDIERGQKSEFSEPATPVLIRIAEGVLIKLGSHDAQSECPTLHVERQPHGWSILLEPVNEVPVATLYFHDDGHSYFARDRTGGLALPLIELGPHEKVPGFSGR